MSDVEVIPQDYTPPSAYFEALRQQWEQNCAFRGFHRFSIGDAVIIGLSGVEIDGVKIESDQRIVGELLDNVLGYMCVTEASGQPQLVDRAIGLGADVRVYVQGFRAVANTIQHAVAPRGEFVYFDPEDAAGTQYRCAPHESLHHLPLKYARLQVGDVVDFDVSNR